MEPNTSTWMIRTGFNKAKVNFHIYNFPETIQSMKVGEVVISKPFSLGRSKFMVAIYPRGARELCGGQMVSVCLRYAGKHKVVVDFSATVGKLKKSYVSEEIAPGDGGRGWLDFMRSSEVGAVFSVVLDVTLNMEEIIEEEICQTRTAEKRKVEDLEANVGDLNNSDLKEEFESSEKRIRTEISNIDIKLGDLDSKLDDEVMNSEHRVKAEIDTLKAKLSDIEVKLEEEVFNSEERVKAEILKMEERLEKKIVEVKQCRVAITAPECPVCFDELKPPLKVVQCVAGHKICEPCSESSWCASQAKPVCPGGCGAKLIGRDHGMEAFLEQIFGGQT